MNQLEIFPFLALLQQSFKIGGPVVWIFLGFSIIVASIILNKIWQILLISPESTVTANKAIALWK